MTTNTRETKEETDWWECREVKPSFSPWMKAIVPCHVKEHQGKPYQRTDMMFSHSLAVQNLKLTCEKPSSWISSSNWICSLFFLLISQCSLGLTAPDRHWVENGVDSQRKVRIRPLHTVSKDVFWFNVHETLVFMSSPCSHAPDLIWCAHWNVQPQHCQWNSTQSYLHPCWIVVSVSYSTGPTAHQDKLLDKRVNRALLELKNCWRSPGPVPLKKEKITELIYM